MEIGRFVAALREKGLELARMGAVGRARCGKAGALALSFLMSYALTACSIPTALDPFCEDKAHKSLKRLEDAVLPHLDKAEMATVLRVEECDSGGDPRLWGDFRPGVSVESAADGLTNPPWSRLDQKQAAEYTDIPGSTVYSRNVEDGPGSDRITLILRGPRQESSTSDMEAGFNLPRGAYY